MQSNQNLTAYKAFLFLLSAGFMMVFAAGETLFQKPTVNSTHVVFEYAGDLWKVDRSGGEAIRLTVGEGSETDPYFSPDGKSIAFTGQYDGNTDVFVIPSEGGVPRRLTYHPSGDEAAGWSPDGQSVLFYSSRISHAGFPRLFTVDIKGGFPQALPLPMGERGSFSPDGKQLAYEPLVQWQPEWKRYRGGQTDKIWIADLVDSSVKPVPRKNSNDRFPMWVGEKVYFLSDREGSYTLYSFEPKSDKVERLIKNDEWDIKTATAWAGTSPAIALEKFGAIYLYNLSSKKSEKVDIQIAADLAGIRPRFEKVANRLYSFGISPSGARAVFAARGEIVTVPAEKGDARNITNTPGVNERDPAWSPDGKWIAYFSDASGEYALHISPQKGDGEVRKIRLPPTFYYSPTWSPDSKKIAYTNKKLELWYIDLDTEETLKVDKNPYGLRNEVVQPIWSTDSNWIAYIRQLDNRLRGVFLYSLKTSMSHQITDGMSDSRHVAFDQSGKYLYFTASTDLGPAFSFAEMSTFPHQSTRSVYAVVLPADLPSPLAPESDEEEVKEDAKEEKKEGDSEEKQDDEVKTATPDPEEVEEKSKEEGQSEDGEKKEKDEIQIDLENIGQRIIALPIPPRNYVGLTTGKANMVYLFELAPSLPTEGNPGVSMYKFDLKERKLDKVTDGIGAFTISANGEKALYRKGPNWFIGAVSAMEGPGGPNGPKILKINEIEIRIDPKQEWEQMYREVWRGERDFLYDPNAHGLDLKAAEKKYQPYLASVAHRADLNYLFTEMLNQLTIGHMFIGGGDLPNPDRVPGGLLGCDYTVENNRYRISKIFNGENWNPNLKAPLTQPGVEVNQGDYLLAVDGQAVTGTDNIYSFFESKSGKQVVIRVGPNPEGNDAREVTVVPVSSESGLRNRDWIESNRRKVDEMSGGRLAYVYVPNTSGAGYESFNRYFFSQTQKQGAVIDERYNGGGSLADYIVEYLTRPILNMIYFREGRSIPTPLGAIYGPKAMIINELAGSGGDALPWYFRKMKVGPLIGKRTWGGLIASFPAPQLMDGGFVTAPDAAIYGLDGDWEVENVGVGPDIEVDYDPAAWRKGQDPQLERAVEYLLEELKKNPPREYRLPPFPVYHD